MSLRAYRFGITLCLITRKRLPGAMSNPTPSSDTVQVAIEATIMQNLRPWAARLVQLNPPHCNEGLARIAVEIAVAALAPTPSRLFEASRDMSATGECLYGRWTCFEVLPSVKSTQTHHCII